MQVHAPVASVLLPYPVVVGMTVNCDRSRAMEGVVRFNRVGLERGGRGNQLEDGQPPPLLAVDTVCKVVWIEGRMADHCQDFAGTGGESYDGAGAVTQRRFCHHLEVQVDGQPQIVARNGIDRRHRTHFLTAAVHDNATHSVTSGEHGIVLSFHTKFAPDVARYVMSI